MPPWRKPRGAGDREEGFLGAETLQHFSALLLVLKVLGCTYLGRARGSSAVRIYLLDKESCLRHFAESGGGRKRHSRSLSFDLPGSGFEQVPARNQRQTQKLVELVRGLSR